MPGHGLWRVGVLVFLPAEQACGAKVGDLQHAVASDEKIVRLEILRAMRPTGSPFLASRLAAQPSGERKPAHPMQDPVIV